MRYRASVVFALGVAAVAGWLAPPLRSQTLSTSSVESTVDAVTETDLALLNQLLPPLVDETEYPPGKFNAVRPAEFDPGKTNLVQAAWLEAIGCPTGATVAVANATGTGIAEFTPFSDTACVEGGDPNDLQHEGLLLVKTGPTVNFASAAAELINVKGLVVAELGYDIRKAGGRLSPLGSHCGGGAPRFLVLTGPAAGYVIGCNSTPSAEKVGEGWTRLRWATPPAPVERIIIIFDEGQDPSGGPDMFGAALLDNISVNGKMVGRGATQASAR